jgi:hypothetical protein
VFIDLTHPFCHFSETIFIGDVINNNNTVSTLVITTSYRLESILTSCIPDLKFACFTSFFEWSDFEIDTDGWHEIIIENIILYWKLMIRI